MMRRGDARAVIAKMILVLQPEPEETSVTHFVTDGQSSTAIARLWKPEDVPRCRLCRHCQLADHPGSRLCTVVVEGHVPEGRAELYAESEGPEPEPEPSPDRRIAQFLDCTIFGWGTLPERTCRRA